MRALLLVIIFSVQISFVTGKNEFIVESFNPFSNFEFTGDTLSLPFDISSGIIHGISIPSSAQNDIFIVSFKIKNTSSEPQRYAYRIFYQNETYKYHERDSAGNYVANSRTNFYGSWNDTLDAFHFTALIPNDNLFHEIIDSFKIVGNPLNDKRYFGAADISPANKEAEINSTIQYIKNTPEWIKQIESKAKTNNNTTEKQLRLDAEWSFTDKHKNGNINNRWKRNPRTGNYSVKLLITLSDHVSSLPPALQHISGTNADAGKNPFYFLSNDQKINNETVLVVNSAYVLKTFIKFDLGKNIYTEPSKWYSNKPYKLDSIIKVANENIYYTSPFEHFYHMDVAHFEIHNIPITADVVNDNYSRQEYVLNSKKFADKLLKDNISNCTFPEKYAYADSTNNKIIIKNPGNSTTPYKKENIGINSRVGLTYGKYIAKIKFPAVLNSDNVWNGITCAFWLLGQAESDGWNNRSACNNQGYIAKTNDANNNERKKYSAYSEIDFEILKTSNYWPLTSYPGGKGYFKDDPESNHDIIITCTNWDLACRNPKNFIVGAKTIKSNELKFTLHRWDDWYKALTFKNAIEHDSIFGKAYYYEIDWEPEKITWKIGPDREHMRIIGFMDKSVTTIPDNQMVILFTQEFHDTKWWPLSPYLQDFIPYPKSDITGEILDLIVE